MLRTVSYIDECIDIIPGATLAEAIGIDAFRLSRALVLLLASKCAKMDL